MLWQSLKLPTPTPVLFLARFSLLIFSQFNAVNIWGCNKKFGTTVCWRETCINLPLLWQSLMLHPGEREGDRKHYHTGYISARISPCCSSFPLLLAKTFSKHCIYQPGFYGLFFLLIISFSSQHCHTTFCKHNHIQRKDPPGFPSLLFLLIVW